MSSPLLASLLILTACYVEASITEETIIAFNGIDESVCGFFDVCRNVKSFADLEECLHTPLPPKCFYNVHFNSKGVMSPACADGISVFFENWATLHEPKYLSVQSFKFDVTFKTPVPADACQYLHGVTTAPVNACNGAPLEEPLIASTLAKGATGFQASRGFGGYNDKFIFGLEIHKDECRVEIERVDYTAEEIVERVTPLASRKASFNYSDFSLASQSEPRALCDFTGNDACMADLSHIDKVADCLRGLPSTCTYLWTWIWDGVVSERCGGDPNIIDLNHLMNPFETAKGTWLQAPDSFQLFGGQLELSFDLWNVSGMALHVVDPEPSSCGGPETELVASSSLLIDSFRDGQGYTFKNAPVTLTTRLKVLGSAPLSHAYLSKSPIQYVLHGAVPEVLFNQWEMPSNPNCLIPQCEKVETVDQCVDVALTTCEFRAHYSIKGSSSRAEDGCPRLLIARLPDPGVTPGAIERISGDIELSLAGDINDIDGREVNVYLLETIDECPTLLDISGLQPIKTATVTGGKVRLGLIEAPQGEHMLYLEPREGAVSDSWVTTITFVDELAVVVKFSGLVQPGPGTETSLMGMVAVEGSDRACKAISQCSKTLDEIITPTDIYECARRASYKCQYTSRRTVSGVTTDVCYGMFGTPLETEMLYQAVEGGEYAVTFHLARAIEDETCSFRVLMMDSCAGNTSEGTMIDQVVGAKGVQTLELLKLPPSPRKRVLMLDLEQGADATKCGLAVISVSYQVKEVIVTNGAAELYARPTPAADSLSSESAGKSSAGTLLLAHHVFSSLLLTGLAIRCCN